MSYNAENMEGLPVGVQVIGQRLEEERVLAMMELIQEALKVNGEDYKLLPVETQ
jgi:Asp-tRNA(Asn)/Glu-tRNA(Gln) amidotransferase A subunit family amidase